MATPPVKVEVQGVEDLRSTLQDVDKKIASKAMRAGLAAGASVTSKRIRKGLRSKFKKKTGKLFKAVGSRIKRIANPRKAEAKAGINVGKKRGEAPHAHLVLLGTKTRATKKGRPRGQIESSDVVQQAYQQASGESRNAMLAKGLKKLEAELAKVKK